MTFTESDQFCDPPLPTSHIRKNKQQIYCLKAMKCQNM